MARRRTEPDSEAAGRTTSTVAPASDLQTRWREMEECPPGMGAGSQPVHLPAKVRVVSTPLRRGPSAGLRAWRRIGLALPVSYWPSLPNS